MFIIYFVVFVAAYFGIGLLCATVGIDLPGDLVLATGSGFVGFPMDCLHYYGGSQPSPRLRRAG